MRAFNAIDRKEATKSTPLSGAGLARDGPPRIHELAPDASFADEGNLSSSVIALAWRSKDGIMSAW